MIALALAAAALVALAAGTALTVAGVAAIVRRRRLARHARALETPLELVVCRRSEVAGELLCVELARPDGGRLPPFVAGQHLLLQGPAGRHGETIRRAYSLAAWTARPERYELAIKREPQGRFSRWAWEALHPGTTVAVLPPRGEFVAGLGRHEAVLVAGGVGITPLRAMLHALIAQERPIVLHHAARHEELLLYRDEFERLAREFPRFRYRPTLSRPGPEWTGARGRLAAGRVLADCASPAHAEFWLCAANAMMDELRAGLIAQGVAPERIHQEAFGAGGGSAPAGLTISVGDRSCVTAGEPTLLATLEEAGLAPESECRAGTCGLCRMRLVSGEVDWRLQSDLALAAGEILPCICAARTDLRLAPVATAG